MYMTLWHLLGSTLSSADDEFTLSLVLALIFCLRWSCWRRDILQEDYCSGMNEVLCSKSFPHLFTCVSLHLQE